MSFSAASLNRDEGPRNAKVGVHHHHQRNYPLHKWGLFYPPKRCRPGATQTFHEFRHFQLVARPEGLSCDVTCASSTAR